LEVVENRAASTSPQGKNILNRKLLTSDGN